MSLKTADDNEIYHKRDSARAGAAFLYSGIKPF